MAFFLGLYCESKNKLHRGITTWTFVRTVYPLFKIEIVNEGQMETQR